MDTEYTSRQILHLAIVASAIGLAALALVSIYVHPPEASISSIGTDKIGSSVTITGVLTHYNEYESVTILRVNDGSEIIVPLFFEPSEPLRKGMTISVSGEVKLYNDKLEVIPSTPRDIRVMAT